MDRTKSTRNGNFKSSTLLLADRSTFCFVNSTGYWMFILFRPISTCKWIFILFRLISIRPLNIHFVSSIQSVQATILWIFTSFIQSSPCIYLLRAKSEWPDTRSCQCKLRGRACHHIQAWGISCRPACGVHGRTSPVERWLCPHWGFGKTCCKQTPLEK